MQPLDESLNPWLNSIVLAGVCLYRETDILAHRLLQAGQLTVNPQEGAIYRPDGTRAELLDISTGYGRVTVQKTPLRRALAHRIIWIHSHGLIPPHILIAHINGCPWDNRIENLTPTPGKVRLGKLLPYP